MAEEIVRVIKIETGGSETTVKSLKAEIESLRDALLNTEKGSQEYDDILEQLIKDQEKLTDAMRAGQKGAKAAEGSYNALVNQMAALKKEWRETTDEVAREKLGKQIEEINTKLKGMDGSLGDYRRDVGNYSQSITAAFNSMGGAAKGMIGPLSSVKAAMTGISSHPIVAALSALAALLIGGIAKGFKSSEENTNKLRVAFSGLQAIADAITKVFQKLAGWIGDVANAIVGLAEKIGFFDTKVGKKFSERMELMKKQIALEKQERDSIVKTAKIESEAAELRAKASDEENYSIEQRIEFLRQAQAKEEENLQLEKSILEQKVSILEAQLALTDSTAEELTKLEELKAQVIKVNTQIAANQRSYNKEINALRRRSLSEAVAARTEYLNLQKSLIEQEYNNAEDGSQRQLELAKELRKKELEIQQEGFKTKIKNRNDYNKAMQLSIQAYNQDIANLEYDAFQKNLDKNREWFNLRLANEDLSQSERLKKAKEYEEQYLDIIQQVINGADLKDVQIGGEIIDEDTLKNISKILGDSQVEELKKEQERVIALIRSLDEEINDAVSNETEALNRLILETTMPLSEMYAEQYTQLDDAFKLEEKIGRRFGETEQEYLLRLNELAQKRTEALLNFGKALRDESDLRKQYQDETQTFSVLAEKRVYAITDLYRNALREIREGRDRMIQEVKSTKSDIQAYVLDNLSVVSANISAALDEELQILFATNPERAAEIEENYRKLFNVEDLSQITAEQLQEVASNVEGFDGIFDTLVSKGVIPEELLSNYIDALRGTVDQQKELINEWVDDMSDLAEGIGQIMGSIGDMFELQLETEKKTLEKEGKFSDEERKILEDRYNNTVKPMKIAEATINTISGAIAAFMGCQELGQPWGAIIGAVQAAAVTAAGVAQIAKIASTNPYSGSGTASAGSTMMATVTPVMTDYQPQMTGSLTGEQETEELVNGIIDKADFYVRVSDINDAQENTRVRVSESTF